MDRKTFLRSCCVGACGLAMFGENRASAGDQDADAGFAPWARRWFVAMMATLDTEVDEKTRLRLMEGPGRACFAWNDEHTTHLTARFGGNLEKFIASAPDRCHREGNALIFSFGAGPDGTSKCACPLVSDAPERMSPTWCACSQAYVKEMFTRIAGRPVVVQRLESIKTGGKMCRFRVELHTSPEGGSHSE